MTLRIGVIMGGTQAGKWVAVWVIMGGTQAGKWVAVWVIMGGTQAGKWVAVWVNQNEPMIRECISSHNYNHIISNYRYSHFT